MHIPSTIAHHRAPRAHHSLLLAVFDMVSIAVAWELTIAARVALNPVLDLHFRWDELTRAAPPLSGVLTLWLVVAIWLGVYRNDSANLGASSRASVLKATLVTGVIAIVVTFFFREFGAALSRSFVLMFLPVSFLTLAAGRRIGLSAAMFEERKLGMAERVAILGAGPRVKLIVQSLESLHEGTIQVVGAILPDGAAGRGNPLRVLGTIRQVGELINRERLSRIIIVGDLPVPTADLEECTRVAARMGVVVSRPFSGLVSNSKLEFSVLPGLGVIDEKPRPITRVEEGVKRLLDILSASVLLAVSAPLLLLFAILVKATSKGPVFYCAPRVGRGGRHFTFFKFRSMYTGLEDRKGLAAQNEKGEHIFKMRADPRVTPLGRFMRRFSIDELPQLFNVLFGDMSLIGPRPLPAQDLDPDGQSRRFRVWAEQRSRVLPGLTGLWQINGRSDLTFENMIEFDVAYIQKWSLWLDLKILLSTPRAVFTGRGAY